MTTADDDPVGARTAALRRAGWTAGDAAFTGPGGGPVWVVSGHNGENLIRAEGSTAPEAWARAVEQARSQGMLGL